MVQVHGPLKGGVPLMVLDVGVHPCLQQASHNVQLPPSYTRGSHRQVAIEKIKLHPFNCNMQQRLQSKRENDNIKEMNCTLLLVNL